MKNEMNIRKFFAILTRISSSVRHFKAYDQINWKWVKFSAETLRKKLERTVPELKKIHIIWW